MNKWISVAMAVLVVTSILNGILYLNSNHTLTNTRSQLQTLKADILLNVSGLQQADVANASALEAHVTAVTSVAAQMQSIVVRIDVTGSGFTDSGSGFIVRNDGYVLTNNHVVLKATSIKVTIFTGDVFDANIVAADKQRDLAMLKLVSSRSDFPVAVLGANSDIIVGDEVLAIGFPLGTALPGPASFCEGIVSALRVVDGLNYIQSDVEINPGNSGGCLATLEGKIIGVTTAAILPPNMDAEGIGLAIPIDEAKTFIEKNVGK